jgi:hypothetical protein
MKIGFSFGRCIRDIVKGEVPIDDVAFLITATYITNKENLRGVIDHYMYEPTYLYGLDTEKCYEVALQLWNTNRVIQPRAQGLQRHAQPESSIWVDIFPTVLSGNESVKKAWDGYRFMLHMIENVDMEATEVFKK